MNINEFKAVIEMEENYDKTCAQIGFGTLMALGITSEHFAGLCDEESAFVLSVMELVERAGDLLWGLEDEGLGEAFTKVEANANALLATVKKVEIKKVH